LTRGCLHRRPRSVGRGRGDERVEEESMDRRRRRRVLRVEVILLVCLARWTSACSPVGGEGEAGVADDDGGDSAQQAHDRQVCRDAPDQLFGLECPPGFAPQFQSGGSLSSVVLAEDAAIPICGDDGLLVDFRDFPGAKWVGYEATKNSICAFGCFAGCGPGQMGCFNLRTGSAFCDWDIDEQSCTEFVDVDDDPEGDACDVEPTDGTSR
jgi:hypothetical protein